MRALVQRTTGATVSSGGAVIGRCGAGLVILVCAMAGDGPAEAEALAARIARLRIFRDAQGRMNRALLDTGGSALVVSQFTLAADTSRGNRPGFSAAADPATGRALCDSFVAALRALGIAVETGEFGADMQVDLVNDGPVTIWLDTADRG